MKFSLLNFFLVFVIISLMAALVSTHLDHEDVEVNALGQWEIDSRLLKESPRWSDRTKPPPISIDEALEVAQKAIKTMESYRLRDPIVGLSDVGHWKIRSIALVCCDVDGNRDQWCYDVELVGEYLPISPDCPYVSHLLVLMNGRAIMSDPILRATWSFSDDLKAIRQN